MKLLIIVMTALLLAFATGPGFAAEENFGSNWNAPVGKGASITYAALMKSVFGDVKKAPASEDWITTSKKVLRRPGEKERAILPAGSRITYYSFVKVRGDGRRYLVLLFNVETNAAEVVGGGASVLAVFAEGKTEPLDVAEVKTDRFCSLGEKPPLPIGPGDAFTVGNSHHNSSQVTCSPFSGTTKIRI
jgi:hypothetical protein